MGFVVKNTEMRGWLDWLMPYRCMQCGDLGRLLCECCKKNIDNEGLNCCLKCHKKIEKRCEDCELPFLEGWAIGYKEGILEKMIWKYKYDLVRGMGRELAELADRAIPYLEGEVIVVPLPTTGRHIRKRGFDHTLMIGRELAKRRGWKCQQVLERTNNTVQVGATAKKRKEQAEKAYKVRKKMKSEVKSGKTYLMLDDVWTTGASMCVACEKMREAGAKNIFALVMAVGKNEED